MTERESPAPASVKHPSNPAPAATTARNKVVLSIAAATTTLMLVGALLLWRAGHKVNRSTLSSLPRPVSFIPAKASTFRPSRTYVGTIEPWIEANIGPQYTSAYVLTVLVRPGSTVTRGEVVATLDCSSPDQSSRAAAMQALAIGKRQHALADESARVRTLLSGGFVAPNESEQKEAQSQSEHAQLLEARARLSSATLDVKDCILRAPFDGEIATRVKDPGAFVRPGETVVSLVDRSTVRVTADAPEKDFDVVKDDTDVTIEALATGAHITAKISRRAPKADPGTRTVHFEIDVPDASRAIPVGTTGMVHIDIGEPIPASEIPVYAAMVTEEKATLFVSDHSVAHKRDVAVLGEVGGSLFLNPQELPAGTDVITEGRALLQDGDRIQAKLDSPVPPRTTHESTPRGAGNGRPQ
jgi:RND family efflux transporter MFP subunit